MKQLPLPLHPPKPDTFYGFTGQQYKYIPPLRPPTGQKYMEIHYPHFPKIGK